MIKPPLHPQESRRQSILERYKILDTMAEDAYDDLTRIASAICGTSIAVISLVDRDRQWFKSKIGLTASETPRDVAFCAHAILQPNLFVVNDASKDARFVRNPLVTAAPNIRFYAGAPLKSPEGLNLGTICVIDPAPKILTPEQSEVLMALSRQVMLLLELRLSLQSMNDLTADLEKAKLTAENLARSKSEFLASMSHEIRTPMNGVLGMMNLLRETELTQEQREYTDSMQSSANGLLTLINDILDFSKIEAGKLHIEQQPFNLDALLSDLEKTFSMLLSEKAVGFEVEKPRFSHELIGDASRLRQVLVNLINNATKFTEKGEIKVRASITKAGNSKSKIRFSIEDTGIGIPTHALSQLFNDFVQVDASTTRKYGGTGLGLSICKRLVNLMGGTIGVESVEHQGSTFWFELEFSHGEEHARSGVEKSVEGALSKTEASRFHILVGEDNIVNQKVIQKTLEKLGFRVTLTSNGAEVLEALEREAFDVVLIDCQMPVMDGFEATRRIRQRTDDLASIPVIALTANAIKGDEQVCLDAGMSDYISKPFKTEHLQEILKKWIRVI